jgi:predicted TIM-barrel fold metal-dependent hydrolase
VTWPVIDTHIHIGVNCGTNFPAEHELLTYLDNGGIDIGIVFQPAEGYQHHTPDWNPFIGNDYIAKIERSFPTRVIGLGIVDPWLQPPPRHGIVTRNITLEEVERCIVELGLHGLKIHPYRESCPINQPQLMFPIFQLLTELQRSTGRRLLIVTHGGGDSIYNTPEAIAVAARHFPELLFLMAHSGFIWGAATLVASLGDCENVKFDLTTMPMRAQVSEAVELYGATRFTAGSDAPFGSAFMMRAIVEDIFASEADRELVSGGNLAQYLELPRR